jgi:non-heme chloroperoxidase
VGSHHCDGERILSVTRYDRTDGLNMDEVENCLSRRDGLKLAAIGLATPLLSALPLAAGAQQYSPPANRSNSMNGFVKVGQENSTPIELYYEDHGSGSPVVLIHGWPLSGASWEKQTAALLAAGHRVITYDRRGFGRSSKPSVGYNYDTFATDLDTILRTLDLTSVSLVGFSMGTGEVTRYIGKFGAQRVRKAVLIGTLGPYLVKAADNPEGVDASVFDGIRAAIKADRPAFLFEFLRNFYNWDVTGGRLVSERVVEDNLNVAANASAIGTLACVDAWIEDFRKDLPRNDVPTLILHGDADRILPPDATSRRQAKMIKGVTYIELKGGPHGVLWTHAEQVSSELVRFLAWGYVKNRETGS